MLNLSHIHRETIPTSLKQDTVNVLTRAVGSASDASGERMTGTSSLAMSNNFPAVIEGRVQEVDDLEGSFRLSTRSPHTRDVSQAFTTITSRPEYPGMEQSILSGRRDFSNGEYSHRDFSNQAFSVRDFSNSYNFTGTSSFELGGHIQKAQDRFTRYSGQSLEFKKSFTSAEFLSFVTSERLRYMPTQGSKLDNVFKKAEAFAKSMSTFLTALELVEITTQESCDLILSSCQIMITCSQRLPSAVERFFSVLERISVTLLHMAERTDSENISPKLSSILVSSLALVVDVTIDIAASLKGRPQGGNDGALIVSFESRFDIIQKKVAEFKADFHMEVMSLLLKNHDRNAPKDLLLVNLRGFDVDSDTIPLAHTYVLIEICRVLEHHGETEKAMKWYQKLWILFGKHRHDVDISTEIWFEVFLEYITILRRWGYWEEVLRVAFELRDSMLADYGPLHHFHIRASIELAKLLELDQVRYKEAGPIYEEICRHEPDGFEDRELIVALIEIAKHRLAQHFEKHSDLAHKMENLLTESFVAAKLEHGPAHDKVIVHLIRVIEYQQKHKGKHGVTNGLKILENYIIDVLVEERDVSALNDVAKQVDKIYREMFSVETGIKFLDVIKEELTSDEIIEGEHGRFTHEQRMSLDLHCFVFIHVLYEMLHGRWRENLLDEIIRELFKEASLYEAWSVSTKVSSSIHLRLIAGVRLLIFLESKGRLTEAKRLRKEMWTMFQEQFCKQSSPSESLWQLFELSVIHLTKKVVPITMVEVLVDVSLEFFHKGDYDACLDLVRWARTYITQLISMSHPRIAEIGFKLGTICHSIDANDKNRQELHRISSEVLVEVMHVGNLREINIGPSSIGQLNSVIRLLGEQKNYSQLERILQHLWDTRFSRNWSGAATVASGRRLCEVKFTVGHHSSAIALLENICYNLRDVYGTLHPLTVDCETLRASFHNTCGNYGAARDIHVHLLQEIAQADKEKVGASQHLHNLGVEQAKRLKWAIHRGVDKDTRDSSFYTTLLGEVKNSISHSSGADVGKLHEAMTNMEGAGEETKWVMPIDWSLPMEA